MSVNKQSAGSRDKIDIIVARPRPALGVVNISGVFDITHGIASTGEFVHQSVKNSILHGFVTRAFAGIVGTHGSINNLGSTSMTGSYVAVVPASSPVTGSTGVPNCGVGLRLSDSAAGDTSAAPSLPTTPGEQCFVGNALSNFRSVQPVLVSGTGFTSNDLTTTSTADVQNDLIYADNTAAGASPEGLFFGQTIIGQPPVDAYTIATRTVTVKLTGDTTAAVKSILLVDPMGVSDGGGGGTKMVGIAGVQVDAAGSGALTVINLTENDTLAVTYTLQITCA